MGNVLDPRVIVSPLLVSLISSCAARADHSDLSGVPPQEKQTAGDSNLSHLSFADSLRYKSGIDFGIPNCDSLSARQLDYSNVPANEDPRVVAFEYDTRSASAELLSSLGIPLKRDYSMGDVNHFKNILCRFLFCPESRGFLSRVQEYLLTKENLSALGKSAGTDFGSWFQAITVAFGMNSSTSTLEDVFAKAKELGQPKAPSLETGK